MQVSIAARVSVPRLLCSWSSTGLGSVIGWTINGCFYVINAQNISPTVTNRFIPYSISQSRSISHCGDYSPATLPGTSLSLRPINRLTQLHKNIQLLTNLQKSTIFPFYGKCYSRQWLGRGQRRNISGIDFNLVFGMLYELNIFIHYLAQLPSVVICFHNWCCKWLWSTGLSRFDCCLDCWQWRNKICKNVQTCNLIT